MRAVTFILIISCSLLAGFIGGRLGAMQSAMLADESRAFAAAAPPEVEEHPLRQEPVEEPPAPPTDPDAGERIVIATPGGQALVLQDAPGTVEIRDAHGNNVRMNEDGVTVSAAKKVTVASGEVEISAGKVTVNAGLTKFNGTMQVDTLISNSVVSQSYSPGAGNIW